MYLALQPGALGVRGTLLEYLALAVEAGFEGLYVNIAEVASMKVEKVRGLFESKNLKPAAWGLPVDVRGDELAYEQGLKKLPELAAVARELGCLRTATYLLSFSDERPFEENFEYHIRRLRPVAEVLADYGSRLGLEFLGPKTIRDGHRYTFIHTVDGILELCDQIGTGNVGLLLDCWHWYTSHGTLEDLKRLRDEHVVDVHVNDAPAGIPIDEQIDQVRCMTGETGIIDLVGFLKVLDDMGYTGPVMAEPFSEKIRKMSPSEAVRTTAEALHQAWRKAGLEG